ncbi:MAG TPA: hypothetical protein VGM88_26450 [Kofleriaceae bacterium]
MSDGTKQRRTFASLAPRPAPTPAPAVAAPAVQRAVTSMGDLPAYAKASASANAATFGPDPWVHVLRRDGGNAFVEPANADAARAGRAILTRSESPGGRLEMFAAGPSADGRLGETRYYREPDDADNATVALGELNHFWVDASELSPIDEEPRGH